MTQRWDTTNATNVTATLSGSLPAGTNNIGDVDVLTLPALPTGTNSIGTVQAQLGTTPFTVTEATNLSTSAVQLASNACKVGVRISNTSTNGNIVTVGDTNVTATRFIGKIFAGESMFFEVTNSNLLFVFGSAASTAFTYGGY